MNHKILMTDPAWRLANLYTIVNKKGEAAPFVRNNIQRKLSECTADRKMILKSRQVGISTNELIACADFAFYQKNKTTCILAHEQDGIEKLFRIIRTAYNFIPDWAKPQLDRGGGSKYELYFPDINSRIYCDLESRGDTIHKLHLSELAFMKDLARVRSTLECVPLDGGQVTIETTANGINHFYELWMDKDTNYAKCFFPWFFHEEYQITQHELTVKSLTKDEREFMKRARKMFHVELSLDQIAFRRFKQNDQKHLFKQEYPEDDVTCFLTSGTSPMKLEIIKPLYDAAKPPLEDLDGIKIFEHAEQSEIYVIGADTAEGFGGDSSVGKVFKVSSRKEVASFASNHCKPSEFADVLIQMANMYSTKSIPPLMAVERNNHGHAVLLKLEDPDFHNYPNLFRHKSEEDKDSEKIRFGWITDKVTRPIMMDTFVESVENGTTILSEKETLGECMTLVNENGKIEASDGNHDDRVIASAIAIQMCIEENRFGVYSDIRSKILI